MNLLHFHISICWQGQVLFAALLGSLDDHKYWVGCEMFYDFIYQDVILTRKHDDLFYKEFVDYLAKPWSGVIPTNDLLPCSDFIEHSKHILQIVRIKEEGGRVIRIFFVRN